MFKIKVIKKEHETKDLVIVHGAYIGQLLFTKLEACGNIVEHSGVPQNDGYYGHEFMTSEQIEALPIIEITFNNEKLNDNQLDLFLKRVYSNEITVDKNYQLSFDFLLTENFD